MRGEIELALADLGVVMRTDNKMMVENRFGKRTDTLHSRILKTVTFTSEEA